MSPKNKTIYYATEARLHRRADGGICSDASQDWYDNHVLWLKSFDEVRIVARVEETPRDSGRLVEGPGVRVLAVPSYQGALGLILTFARIRILLRRSITDADAVYGGRFPGIIAGLTVGAGRAIGAKTFAHVVGDPHDVLKSGVAGWLGVKLAHVAQLLMAYQVSRVDGAIYVSEETLQRRYPVHGNARSLSRSGVSVTSGTLAEQAKVPDALRRCTTIVAVGTHDQMYKGHDLLLEALARLRARGNDVRLDVVGGGSKHELLVRLARDLGVDAHVRFLGHVETPQQIRDILDAADLFAMPSRTEGVPRALIEAMARGLPCIGSNVGGIPELLPPECLFTSNSVEELTQLLQTVIHDEKWLTEQGLANLERAREICRSLDPQRVSDFFSLLTAVPKVMDNR